MQNPEEDILKRFLQDTFSDYEPMPTEQSWEQIHKAIHPQKPSLGSRLKQWIVPVVALLLLIGGGVWDATQSSDELKDNSIALLTETEENKLSVNTPSSSEGSRPSKGRLPFAQLKLDKLFKINKLEDNVTQQLVSKTTSKELGELPTVTKKQSEVFEVIPEKLIENEKLETYVMLVSLDEKSLLEISENESYVANAVRVKNPVSVNEGIKPNISNAVRVQNPDSPASVNEGIKLNNYGTVRVKPPVELSTSVDENYQPINNAIITEVRYVKPIESLKNKDFVISKPQFEQAKINQINVVRETKPIRRPTYISLSIMPLQTYRILTVGSRDIHDLQTNKLFDSERNGFALELGIVKPIANSWNLRGGLSYLKMHQWAEYQVNTEVVSVKNSYSNSNNSSVGTTDNEFIGQTQIENKTLQMVGLKADVQKFLKITGRNRYFISGGTQMMYETSEKQTNVFINASAGFQHIVNKDLFLTVEPTASYLLYNINDSKSLIQTNAYNLGLKIGVNFRVK